MRRLLGLVLAFSTCGIPSEPEERVGVLRQAGGTPISAGPPTYVGVAGARLGHSLTACPNGDFLAGAPGSNKVFVFPSGMEIEAPIAAGFGTDVACGNSMVGVTASGAAFTSLNLLTPFATGVRTIEPNPLTGTMYFSDGTSTWERVSLLNSVVEQGGNALAFAPGTSTWAIAHANTVTVYTNGSAATELWTLPWANATSIAVGNFHPAGNAFEVAFTAGSEVRVYRTDSANNSPVFQIDYGGAAAPVLATRPGDAGLGLQELWIGVPNEGSVVRTLGARRDSFGRPLFNPTQFGFSLAFPEPQTVVVGEPGYSSDAGAVHVFDAGASWITGLAVAMDCADTLGCQPDTRCSGVCIGNVVCAQLVCTDAGVIEPDAGTMDAGPDGGQPDGGQPDAGQTDAGQPDAGQPDAGQTDAGQTDGGQGQPDGGQPDAGEPDAGTSDAGTPDAGMADAGAPDAGAGDAGVDERDAGTADAGASADAGEPADGGALPTQFVADCGCQSVEFLELALVLALLRRARHLKAKG